MLYRMDDPNALNALDLNDEQIYVPAELADRSRFDRTTICSDVLR
jgi:hypothetical protein